MILLNNYFLDDYKKTYPHLSSSINRFIIIAEKGQWETPEAIKEAFVRHADYVAPFWIIDIGGKAGARIILRVHFREKTIKIERIWMNHSEYMRWSKNIRKRK